MAETIHSDNAESFVRNRVRHRPSAELPQTDPATAEDSSTEHAASSRPHIARGSPLRRAANYLVDDSILDRIPSAQDVVAVGVAFDLLVGLAGGLGHDLVHPPLSVDQFPGVYLHVRGLSSQPLNQRLVKQYPRVRRSAPLALLSHREQERPGR
jgi:hypothetical protein